MLHTAKMQIISTMRADKQLARIEANSLLSYPVESLPFYMFSYHRDRMLRAARDFGWNKAAEAVAGVRGFHRLLEVVTLHLKEKPWNLQSQPQPARVRTSSFKASPSDIDSLGPHHAIPSGRNVLHIISLRR